MFDGMMTGPPPPSCATDVGLQPPSMPAAAASAFDFMSCASVGGGAAPPLPCQTTPAEAPPPTQPGGAIASTSMRSTGLPGASVAPPPSSSGSTDWASATGDKAAVRKKKVAQRPSSLGWQETLPTATATARRGRCRKAAELMQRGRLRYAPAVPGAQAAGRRSRRCSSCGGVGSFGGACSRPCILLSSQCRCSFDSCPAAASSAAAFGLRQYHQPSRPLQLRLRLQLQRRPHQLHLHSISSPSHCRWRCTEPSTTAHQR